MFRGGLKNMATITIRDIEVHEYLKGVPNQTAEVTKAMKMYIQFDKKDKFINEEHFISVFKNTKKELDKLNKKMDSYLRIAEEKNVSKDKLGIE